MENDSKYLFRKIALVAVGFLVMVAATRVTPAQTTWVQNGSNISSTNTGNVGVGTTTPSSKFEVQGSPSRNTMSLIGDGDSVGYSGFRIGALTTTNISNNRTSYFSFHMRKDSWYGGDGSGPSFIIETASPSGGFAAPFLITPTNDVILNGGKGNSGLSYGNVGIGTTAPGSLFEVRRDQATFTEVRVNNSNTAGFSGVYLNRGLAGVAGGFLQWNNRTGENNLFVSTAGSAPLYLGTDNTPRMTVLPTSGLIGVGTTSPTFKLDVQGGQINASGGLCIAGICKGSWSEVGGGGATSPWTTLGSSVWYSGGNVGVGTSIPGVRLAVGGPGSNIYNTELWVENNLHAQGNETLAQGGRGRLRVGTAWGYMGLYTENSSTNLPNDLVLGAGSGKVRVGPNAALGLGPISFIVPNGNIGVGTTSPAVRLDLFGANVPYGGQLRIAAPDYAQITFFNSNDLGLTDAGRKAAIYYDTAASQLTILNTSNGGSGSLLLQPLGTGRVGVGTSAPGFKLDVQGGQINASNGLCINGVCKSSWSDVGGGTSQWITNAPNIHYSSGSVGVGVAVPEQTLHVNGASEILTTGAGAGFKFRNRGSSTTDDWVWYSSGNVARFYRFGTGDLMGVTTDGKLGLGTTAPKGKFEVAGGSIFLGDMGNTGWGNMIARGRVLSANSNIHLSPPGGYNVYIDSGYREAGGPTGDVNLVVSGTITGGNIQAKFQDVAEWVPSTQKLAAGTVVVLDTSRNNHVMASTKSYDTKVAGVISLTPGVILGEGGEGKLKVATTGRVRIRVDASRGPISVGDLLVTSEVEGVAMKSIPIDFGGTAIHRPGTIIGKALEPLASGVGDILVLLSLQ